MNNNGIYVMDDSGEITESTINDTVDLFIACGISKGTRRNIKDGIVRSIKSGKAYLGYRFMYINN